MIKNKNLNISKTLFVLFSIVGGLMFGAFIAYAATLFLSQGGMGTATVPSSGQIPIGTSGGVYTPANLTAGTNVTVTNSSGEITISSSGGGTPGGSDTQVQFNDGGSFGGDSGLIFNKTTNDLTILGAVNGSSTAHFLGPLSLTSTASSTWLGGLNVGVGGLASSHGLLISGGSIQNTGTATSTFTGGISIKAIKIGTLDCNGANTLKSVLGVVVCATDVTGGSATATSTLHYFDVSRLLSTSLRATSTSLTFWTNSVQRAFIDTNGSLNASSTFHATGAGNFGGLLTLPAGVTITCTACVTDTNVADGLTISGGTVNNSVIGGVTPAAGSFTTLSASGLSSLTGANLTGVLNASSTFHVDGNSMFRNPVSIGTSTADVTRNLLVEGNGILTGTLRVGPIVGTSTLNLAGIITDTSTATSSFSGGISAAIGGLSSSHGLLLSGGVLVEQSAGTSTFTGGISSANFVATKGITSGFYNTSGVTTSTWLGGLSVGATSQGLASAHGLQLSGGVLNVASAGTSTFTGGATFAALGTAHGLNLTGGVISSSGHLILQTPVANKGIGFGTTTPWGSYAFEQLSGASYPSIKQPIFAVGDTGTSSPFFSVNQKGQILIGTTTPSSIGTTTANAVMIAGALIVDTGRNGSSTVFSLGDIGSPGCFEIRDQGNAAWSYLKVRAGVGTFTAVSCK